MYLLSYENGLKILTARIAQYIDRHEYLSEQGAPRLMRIVRQSTVNIY